MQSTAKTKNKNPLNENEQYFLEMQNHCALCGSELEIKVESYLEDFYIREEADCPKCRIRTREKNHRMH